MAGRAVARGSARGTRLWRASRKNETDWGGSRLEREGVTDVDPFKNDQLRCCTWKNKLEFSTKSVKLAAIAK